MSSPKSAETFTRSSCDCNFCLSTHLSIQEWDTFVPETHLQHSMKKVVTHIERQNNSLRKPFSTSKLRRSPRLAAMTSPTQVTPMRV